MPARAGSFADGPAATARFDRPTGLAVLGGGGRVADLHNPRIRRVDPSSREVSTLAGSQQGFQDGPGSSAQFNAPSALALSPEPMIYVLDTYNQAIRRVTPAAPHTVTTLVGGDSYRAAYADGPGTQARLGCQA